MNKFAVPAAACSGKTRVLLRAAAIAALVTAIAPANAGNLWCGGTLKNLFVDANGAVLVLPSWRSDYVQVCNVNQATASGIQPTTCLSWLSLMRSAVQRNASTTMYYASASAATCAAMPTYSSAPTPNYVMLEN